MTPEELGNIIAKSGPHRVSQEAHLQQDLEGVFEEEGVEFEPEFRASRTDRFDFLVDGCICVELKVKGQPRAILRQLKRYAEHSIVTSILLVTLRTFPVPATINGKPVFVVNLGVPWLQ